MEIFISILLILTALLGLFALVCVVFDLHALKAYTPKAFNWILGGWFLVLLDNIDVQNIIALSLVILIFKVDKISKQLKEIS